jgi:ribosomal-protein-alanine N-acetyltransferase
MSEITLRVPVSSDAAALIAIENACFTDPWEDESFQRLADNHEGNCRVAELDGRVVGYWIGSRIDDEAELANLAVDPALQRGGIGRALLEDFLTHVGAPQGTTVFLEVRASNTPAIQLYRRYGFTDLARRTGYYMHPEEDALVMARRPSVVRTH